MPTDLTGPRLAHYTASYDAVGQLTGVVELDGSRVTYSYDPSGQLSSEMRSGSGAYAITYSYDALGNRLSKTEDGVLTSYSYGAANQLQSEQTGAASTTYLYDENGNVRSEQTGTLITTYTWDEENRLTKVEYADGSVDTYVYFQDGRRYKAQSTLGAVTSTTLFIWDGLNLLLEEDAGLIARVQWTNFPDEAREVLVMRQAGTSGLSNGASFFPGFDLSGNTRLMMGAAGISKWRGLYKSFGEERALIGYGGQVAQSTLGAGYGGQTSGLATAQRYGGQAGSTFEAALNHLRFGGQVGYYTDRNGRIYVRARHYDSRTGRWLSRDPIGFGGGDWNLCRYVGNAPANFTDPDGLAVDPNRRKNKGNYEGKIRIVFNAFIPYNVAAYFPTRKSLWTGHKGDNRNFAATQAAGGARYRAEHIIILDPKTGGCFTPIPRFGVTHDTVGMKYQQTNFATKGIRPLMTWCHYLGNGKWKIKIKGRGTNPMVTPMEMPLTAIGTAPGFGQGLKKDLEKSIFSWAKKAPDFYYELDMVVSENGFWIDPKSRHTLYPGLELWKYRDYRPPALKFGYIPPLSVLDLILGPRPVTETKRYEKLWEMIERMKANQGFVGTVRGDNRF